MLNDNKFPEQKQLVHLLLHSTEDRARTCNLTSAQRSKHKNIINFTILYDISS